MWRSGRHDDIPFFWSGKGPGEFKLKRRHNERSTILIAQATHPAATISVLFSSGAPGRGPTGWSAATNIVADGHSSVALVPADVNHVKINAEGGHWSARTLDADDLPMFAADGESGKRGGVFRHGLGPIQATVSCQETVGLTLLQLCHCEGVCENERHRMPTAIATIEPTTGRVIRLPEGSGVLVVLSSSSWSIVPEKDASDVTDASDASDLSASVVALVRAEVRAEVARLLPGLVAKQLAAIGVTATGAGAGTGTPARDAGRRRQIPRRDEVPSWFRQAREVVDDFENQLTTIDLAAEPDTKTRGKTERRAERNTVAGDDMRRYQWIATEALEKANRILDEAGKKDQSTEVYAAVARGREAVARLDALRHGRPVPLEVLTREELAGAPMPDRSVHTAERFAWSGKGEAAADFYLDRPFPHRTVLLEVSAGGAGGRAYTYMTLMERTDAVVAAREAVTCRSNTTEVVPADPSITHLKITSSYVPWSVRAVDPERYPFLEDMTRCEGSRIFRHRLGAVNVTIQCLDSLDLRFFEFCDCTRTCNKREHQRRAVLASFSDESRDHCQLPRQKGLLAVTTSGRWSLDITPPASSAR